MGRGCLWGRRASEEEGSSLAVALAVAAEGGDEGEGEGRRKRRKGEKEKRRKGERRKAEEGERGKGRRIESSDPRGFGPENLVLRPDSSGEKGCERRRVRRPSRGWDSATALPRQSLSGGAPREIFGAEARRPAFSSRSDIRRVGPVATPVASADPKARSSAKRARARSGKGARLGPGGSWREPSGHRRPAIGRGPLDRSNGASS
ncbi:hypothetical protein KM043_003869 [Ampulex compressa]|nr:hypothetical protein KM043_003869 [Ampulex compressa]